MNEQAPAAPRPVDAAADETTAHTLLIVDDSVLDRHLAGAIVQKLEGWKATFAAHGLEALDMMAQQKPDAVLTDMIMPEMGGLELVQAIRSRYPLTPVVLMTAHGSEDVALQALQKGAASYLPKKTLARDLAETLEQVMSAVQSNRNQQRIVESLTLQQTTFTLANDTTLIAPLVSFIEDALTRLKLCEPSGLILLGVAMHEALTNAILHGNLELESTLKEQDEKAFYRLAQERRREPPYSDRRVTVELRLSRPEAVFVVRDEGHGFDPATLPDPTDPANLGRVHGRGLLLIHTFMDRVQHNDKGNEITMTKHCG
jgi:CheY-like chemotaxis protein/anti-sigma regulatory factor (Ser/Thr protein kinase)